MEESGREGSGEKGILSIKSFITLNEGTFLFTKVLHTRVNLATNNSSKTNFNLFEGLHISSGLNGVRYISILPRLLSHFVLHSMTSRKQ